ncbi:MAG: hypothetical protein QOG04_2292 [Actinomycetota bacterium]|jgi:hypothetical protein|nr:hypothetical protein [Actinomycetota bacterium]
MVTVLLVGASLTAVAAVASFATIREFKAGKDDRNAALALSYAEAGVDRFINYMKSGRLTYAKMNTAGCNGKPAIALPPGQIASGSYTASLTVYDPNAATPADRFPIPPSSGACASRPDSPHPGQGNDLTYFLITSTGTNPAASRTVQQVVALTPVGLPIGMYARQFDPKAHPAFTNISSVSETTHNDRQKNQFSGIDSYYLIRDFFSSVTGRSLDEHIPAAAHAVGGIFLKNSGTPEFTGPTSGYKNCSGNTGVASQSLWDSDGSAGSGGPITSGCAGQVGYPSNSSFSSTQLSNFAKPRLTEQDHQALKEAAKAYGVYCALPAAGIAGTATCTVKGVSNTYTPAALADYKGMVQSVLNGSLIPSVPGTNTFVVYIEFTGGIPSLNNIGLLGDVWGCTDLSNPDNNKSVVVVVRNGGADWGGAGGTKFTGALLLDGNFTTTGSLTIDGSIIAPNGTISFGSSSQLMTLSDCWVENMPGPFLKSVPGRWSEVDR